MEAKDLGRKAARWIIGTPHGRPVTILKTMIPIRGFAILLVVMAHAVIMMLAAEDNLAPGTTLSPDIFGLWQIASFPKSIVLELCSCAVPIFLFLSGYFTLSSPQTWKAIWSNCRKLLYPMITWSLAAWAFSWRKGSGGWSLSQFAALFISGKAQTGYFFIVLILQYYALSRWLVPAIKRRPGLILACSALIQLSVHAYDYLFLLSELEAIAPIGWILRAGPFPEYLFPRFMASFALGIWASQASQRFRTIIVDRFAAVLASAALAAALLAFERGVLFRRAYAVLGKSEFEATSLSWVGWKLSMALWTIAAIFLVFGWFQRRIPMKSLFDALGKYSFQIFILHGIALDIVRPLMYKFLHGLKFYGLTGCLVLLVSGIAGPILLTRLIQKRAPAALRLVLLGA